MFLISIELLSNYIENDNTIKGIQVNGTEIKQTLFADDATFCTDGSKQSFENFVNVLNNFGNISGLKLNRAKCTVLRSGTLKKLKNCKVTFCKKKMFIWTSESAKTLGVNFHNDSSKTNSHG